MDRKFKKLNQEFHRKGFKEGQRLAVIRLEKSMLQRNFPLKHKGEEHREFLHEFFTKRVLRVSSSNYRLLDNEF